MEQVHHGFGIKNLFLIIVMASVLMLSYLFQKEARLAYNDRQNLTSRESRILGVSIEGPDVPLQCLGIPLQTAVPPRSADPDNEC
jgi:hypothetical protein